MRRVFAEESKMAIVAREHQPGAKLPKLRKSAPALYLRIGKNSDKFFLASDRDVVAFHHYSLALLITFDDSARIEVPYILIVFIF